MADLQPNLLGLLVVTTALGFLALALVTVTSFVKISVVLFLLRNALGVQQSPPNIVLYGITLILTVFVSMPLARGMYASVTGPGAEYNSFGDYVALARRAEVPLREHLSRYTTPPERQFFLGAASRLWPEEMREDITSDDLAILVPSFLIAELKRSFEIGFLLYLPFVAIDLVITTILMAMGMSQVQPNTIGVPLKLFLFVIVEGWTRLLHGLVLSYVY